MRQVKLDSDHSDHLWCIKNQRALNEATKWYRWKMYHFKSASVWSRFKRSYAYLCITGYCAAALTPYLFSMGRLYSSQSYALTWGGDGASPQVTALCFGIFGTRVPFFWFWLPGEGGEYIKVIADVWLTYLKFSTVHCSCWPYLRCCCYLCLSCCVSLLCCDHGSGCRG